MTDKITAYRAMQAAMNAMDNDAMDVDMDTKMDMTMTSDGETMTVPSNVKGSMKMIVDGADVKMAYTTETEAQGIAVKMDMWMKDGWVYLCTTTNGQETKLKYTVEDQLAAAAELSMVDMTAMDVSGLAMLESVTSKKVGGNTEYTIVIGEGMNSMVNSVSDMMGNETAGMNMRFGKMTAAYTVDSKGNLKKINMVFTASVKMDLPMEDGQTLSMAVDYDYDMTMTVNATGKAVKVTFPDFSDYLEIDPNQMVQPAA